MLSKSKPLFSPLLTYRPDSLRPGIAPKLDALRHLYEGKKIIVGRDKLDVVKGVLQKVCGVVFFLFYQGAERYVIVGFARATRV